MGAGASTTSLSYRNHAALLQEDSNASEGVGGKSRSEIEAQSQRIDCQYRDACRKRSNEFAEVRRVNAEIEENRVATPFVEDVNLDGFA